MLCLSARRCSSSSKIHNACEGAGFGPPLLRLPNPTKTYYQTLLFSADVILMSGIIWIASYPKSGNTWLRAFIHNLFFNSATAASINELDKVTMGDGRKDWYGKVAGGPVDGMDQYQLAQIRPRVHQLMSTANSDSVFVKTHSPLTEQHGTPAITMDCTSGAIYILRNPMDVVLSMSHHSGLDVDTTIDLLANATAGAPEDPRNIPITLGTWSQHVKSWTQDANESLYVVRYEDLYESPKVYFGNMVHFLGLHCSSSRLSKAINFSSFDVLQKQEQSQGFRERSPMSNAFFRSGEADQWRSHLSRSQIDKIVAAHGDQMDRFNYLP